MLARMTYLKGLASVLFAFVLFTNASYSQESKESWETIFAKAQIQYYKGKYHKVPKKLKKLKKKLLASQYDNDSTVIGMAYVLEAMAAEGKTDYAQMLRKSEEALDILETYKDQNPYAYAMGILRLVDLYQHYGNFITAESYLSSLESHLSGSDALLLKEEAKIRRAVQMVETGQYIEAKLLLSDLVGSWSTSRQSGYDNINTGEGDKAYLDDLWGRIIAYSIKARTKRGEFQAADSMYSAYRKSLEKLLPSTSFGSSMFRLAYAANAFEWQNYKEGRKRYSKLVKSNPTPSLKETILEEALVVNILAEKEKDAMATKDAIEKVLKKGKAGKGYQKFKNELNQIVYDSYIEAQESDITQRFSALPVSVLPADHAGVTRLYTLSTNFIQRDGASGDFTVIEKLYQQLAETNKLRYPEDAIQIAFDKIKLAGYYLKYSDSPAEAFSFMKGSPQELVMSQITVQHPIYQTIIDDLNEFFILRGEYEYPIALKKEAVKAQRENPNVERADLGSSILSLAKLQTLGGYYQDAEANAEEGLKLIRRDGEKRSKEYVVGLNNTAFLYGTMGLYSQAKRLLNRSSSLLKKIDGNTKTLKLNAIEDLAFLYTRLGNYKETSDLLDDVIKEKSKLYTENSYRLIKPYFAKGEMHLIKGEFPESEKYLRLALNRTKDALGDSTLSYANILSKRVLLDIELGLYREALLNASQVLAIRSGKLRDNHIKLGETYQLLGLIYLESGLDDELAESYFKQSRDIVLANFDNKHPLYAEALQSLAYVKIRKKDLDAALALLIEADEIWDKKVGNKSKNGGEVARLIGDIYAYKKDFKKARQQYNKSARYFRQIFNREHPEYLTTRSRLARAAFVEGELNSVEDILSETTGAYLNYTKTYFPTLSEDEKAKFWAKIKPDFEFYNTVAVSLSETKPKYLEDMYDFALATKGLLLNSSIKTRNAILNSGDEELIKLFEKWIENKELLTNLLSQSEEELSENGINVSQIQDETEQLEKQLSAQSEDFANTFEYKFYGWNDVRKVLGPNEAAVEIIRYREFDEGFNEDKVRYAALIVTAETRKNPKLVLLENGNEIETKFFKLQRNGVKFKVAESRSYYALWDPIYRGIGEKSIVFLSPDGVYNQVNIESLNRGEGQFVIDTQNVRVVGNTKTLAITRSKGAKKQERKLAKKGEVKYTALLVGNPVYYNQDVNSPEVKAQLSRGGGSSFVPQLPGTEKEVATISDLLKENSWDINYLLGKEADEAAIKAAQNRTLIHIATHGFFDESDEPEEEGFELLSEENPLDRSGLMAQGAGEILLKTDKNYNIEDGILTATEAMNMNFDNTELVVLSACETGRGEVKQGEGVYGLQRSFMVAGADAIVMSLFKVSDEVTQNLMIEFYKNWLAGDDKRIAFNKAQKTIKEKYPEPIYWGAFTMIAKN